MEKITKNKFFIPIMILLAVAIFVAVTLKVQKTFADDYDRGDLNPV